MARLGKEQLLVTTLLCVGLTLYVAACSFGVDKATLDVLREAIDELESQPDRWEGTLENVIDKLGDKTTQTAREVLAEVDSLYNNALGQTESVAFCGLDFVGDRVRQRLQSILHRFDRNSPPATIVPVVCLTEPTDVKARETPLVKYYGYDFLRFKNTGVFKVDLEYASGQVARENFGFVSITSNYLLQVDVQGIQGSDWAIIDATLGPKLVLKWNNQTVQTEDGQSELPILIPTPISVVPGPIEPQSVTYIVTLVTGCVSYAGTDANVYITLVGSRGRSEETQLDIGNHDDREWCSRDSYQLMADDLGELSQIAIRHDNSNDNPGWFLDRVIVRLPDGREWEFPCNRWLATDEEDGHIFRTVLRGGPCQ
jgi:hypothetical protein